MRYLIALLFVQMSFSQDLTLPQANHLASLPLKCLHQEYPNKPGETLIDNSEVVNPKKAHPAFYGCFDWHSSVHGHWSLVYLLNNFPKLDKRDEIISKLKINLSKENVAAEVAYLSKKHEKSFERTYGWTWVLKLQHELEKSKDPYATELAVNLKPLSDLVIARYIEFLPKLLYPIRVGTHSSTAFGLSFAWDYAVFSKNGPLQESIRECAVRLFNNDKNCPLTWEPSGYDFLSPCLEEVGIMQRVLPKTAFLDWLRSFAPSVFNKDFKWEAGKVSDRTDGHLVHLDGLNFSRAWNFYRLIKQYPDEFAHLKTVADYHMNHSLPMVVDGNYEGEHWLASFALHAYEER